MGCIRMFSSRRLFCALTALAVFAPLNAQEPSVSEGYTLVAPIGDSTAYLINNDKEVIHSWRCNGGAGNATYLRPDGSLLRTGKVRNQTFPARGGPGGLIEIIDWDSEVLWSYEVSDDDQLAHHDVEPMPNGNVLVIAWQYRSRDEAISFGRDPSTLSEDALWPESIIELKPKGKNDAEVVWRWDLWDHLIQEFDKSKKNFGKVADHPELVDINFGIRRGGADWIHMNSVDYNADLDQIVMSARWFNEVWIIDHSTTKEEAAGHTGGRHGKGGDLLYRWGNPYAYFAGFEFDRQLWAQHDARWIDKGSPGAGNLMVFNNGDRRAGRGFSSVDEFKTPVGKDGSYDLPASSGFGPESFVWTYKDEGNFLSERISGAQRMPNGNTLICSGEQGSVFEVSEAGKIVWQFEMSDVVSGGTRPGGGGLFRAPKYSPDLPAFSKLGK